MNTEKFSNPTKEIRNVMIREFEKDEASGKIYSPKTTIFQDKVEEYKSVLKTHIKEKTLPQLIIILKSQFINWSTKQKDGIRRITSDSDSKLAEGE